MYMYRGINIDVYWFQLLGGTKKGISLSPVVRFIIGVGGVALVCLIIAILYAWSISRKSAAQQENETTTTTIEP